MARIAAMNEAIGPISKILENLAPGWLVLAIVAAILAYQSPKLLRELFAGIKGLRTSKGRKGSRSEPSASSN
jgi:hypothetical protein